MDLFSMLINDPVVGASVAVIVVTFAIITYLAGYFIKNIIAAESHKND